MNVEILVGLLWLFAVVQICSVLSTRASGFQFVNLQLIPFISAGIMIWAAIYIQTIIH